MGRWAQARRTGGGIVTLNEMIEAIIIDSTTIEIEYRLPVSAASLDPTVFIGSPSGNAGVNAVQLTPTVVGMQFGGTIITDSLLVYAGVTPGLRTPQTIQTTQ